MLTHWTFVKLGEMCGYNPYDVHLWRTARLFLFLMSRYDLRQFRLIRFEDLPKRVPPYIFRRRLKILEEAGILEVREFARKGMMVRLSLAARADSQAIQDWERDAKALRERMGMEAIPPENPADAPAWLEETRKRPRSGQTMQ